MAQSTSARVVELYSRYPYPAVREVSICEHPLFAWPRRYPLVSPLVLALRRRPGA